MLGDEWRKTVVYLHKIEETNVCLCVCVYVIGHGFETWLFTVREKHRLRVFENRAMRRVPESKEQEVTGEQRRLLMKSCITCALHQTLLG
jgi:hypothetical protein